MRVQIRLDVTVMIPLGCAYAALTNPLLWRSMTDLPIIFRCDSLYYRKKPRLVSTVKTPPGLHFGTVGPYSNGTVSTPRESPSLRDKKTGD